MIYVGADHGGFELKEKIKKWLDEWKLEYQDMGSATLDPNDDYPVSAFAVADKVAAEDDPHKPWGERPKGILACRSAAGVVIAANKVKGISAVGMHTITGAAHSREHNNSNVMALAGDWIDDIEAKEIVRIWLATEFSDEERHKRRLAQIAKREMGS